jgi:hypothetical protein
MLTENCKFWDSPEQASQNDPTGIGLCLGMIFGFSDGFELGNAAAVAKFTGRSVTTGKTGYELWCEPAGVTNKQAVAVFMKWADRNPARWHEPYNQGLIAAFKEAWPCRK